MFSKDIFRAYDIRGIYPEEVNKELTKAVSEVLCEKFFGKGAIVVGMDARIGSKEMHNEALSTLEEKNKEVIDAGIITTPMLTFLVNELDAGGGIMITASHNPKEYNGIKAIGKDKEPVSGEDIYKELSK